MEQPTCGWCHTPLEPPNRKWCSDVCRAKGRYHANVDASRAYHRARYGTNSPPPADPFDCAQCGIHCTPGENVGRRATKFCSLICRRRWHQPPSPPKPPGWVPRRKREKLAIARRKILRASRGTSGIGRRTLVGARCAHCSQVFVTQRVHAGHANVYCTDRCARRAADQTREARKRSGAGNVINRAAIFERDGYVCQLCGGRVAMAKVAPHPKSPTIDHIIPLAKGGTHEPANVQLAHFMCNSIKSDKVGGAGDQLRLIG